MNSQIKKVNLFESLADVTYSKSNVDYVTNALLEYHEQYPNNEVYKVQITIGGSYSHKVFTIKHSVSVKFHDKVYPIALVIYLMNDFPNIPPEVYIDRSIPHIGVNPKYTSNNEINPLTFKISNNYILSWKRSNSSLRGLLTEIENAFNSIFPVYKNKEADQSNGKHLLSCFHLQDKTMIDFENGSTISRNSGQQQQPKLVNKNFSDSEIKELYMNELFETLKPILSKQYDKIKKDEDIAKNFKNHLQGGVESMTQVLRNQGLVLKDIEQSINQVSQEVSALKDEIEKNSNGIDFSRIQDIIEISNDRLIRAVSIEANIEELLLIIKKAFEREVIEVDETLRFIRNLSRECFKIKYYREKLLS